MKNSEMDALPRSEPHDRAATEGALTEKLPRNKRGMAPVTGFRCDPSYKKIGDDCVPANPEFD
ncbi:hypothetical protein [Pseudomonas faucium]|uniref:hypothetical protein n=1 Tax=Pseudomonas faucium TaxID=2740518 RepID=UPI0015969849|nr:hypothetical protein [Pseudomonas faucium]